MMAGQEEGNYASSASANVGLQQTSQGLTLPLKTQAADSLYSDQSFLLTDEDFDEALKQVESFQRGLDIQKSFFPPSICGLGPSKDASLCKKRKYGEAAQNWALPGRVLPGTVHQSRPSFSAASAQDKTVAVSQILDDNGEENTLNTVVSKDSISMMHNPKERHYEYQKDRNNNYLSGNGQGLPIGKINLVSESTEVSNRLPSSNYEAPHYGLDFLPPSRDMHRLVQNRVSNSYSEVKRGRSCSRNVADKVKISQQGDFWDPDVPLPSIETGYPDLSQNCGIDEKISTRRLFDKPVSRGALNGVRRGSRGSSAGSASQLLVKTNPLPRTRQHSPKALRTSQASKFASTASSLLTLSHQTSVYKSASNPSHHQIPADLRALFDAILQKFHTDKQFHKSVMAYVMESPGAMAAPSNYVEQDLTGMSREQIIDAYHILRWRLAVLNDTTYISPLPTQPSETGPTLERWHCFNTDENDELCGTSNTVWTPTWTMRKSCKKCGHPSSHIPGLLSSDFGGNGNIFPTPNQSSHSDAMKYLSPSTPDEPGTFKVFPGGTFGSFQVSMPQVSHAGPPNDKPPKRQRSRKSNRDRSENAGSKVDPTLRQPSSEHMSSAGPSQSSLATAEPTQAPSSLFGGGGDSPVWDLEAELLAEFERD